MRTARVGVAVVSATLTPVIAAHRIMLAACDVVTAIGGTGVVIVTTHGRMPAPLHRIAGIIGTRVLVIAAARTERHTPSAKRFERSVWAWGLVVDRDIHKFLRGASGGAQGEPVTEEELTGRVLLARRVLTCCAKAAVSLTIIEPQPGSPRVMPPAETCPTHRGVISSSSFPGSSTGVSRGSGIVLSRALLKPLLPLATLSSCPSLILSPLRNTSALRSTRNPTASLFLSPTQTWAGLRTVGCSRQAS